MSRDVETGNKLREKRLDLGWSAEQSAAFYGEALKGIPITRKAYLRMEEGYLPKDPKRRIILAGMFGLAPAVLIGADLLKSEPEQFVSSPAIGKRRKTLNLTEYRASLLSYWKQGYSGTADEALRDLTRRIRALHEKVLYVSSEQKEEMKQLLCGYHMRKADIAREQGYYTLALEHLNNAIILAHEEHYLDFEAAALYRRGEFYFDRGNLKAALRDFNTVFASQSSSSQSKRHSSVPVAVKGRSLVVGGLTVARLAQTEKEMTKALSWIDAAEPFANQDPDDIYFMSLTKTRYFLERAKALVGSPVKQLHAADEALELTAEVDKQSRPEAKRHYTYHQMECHMVQAQVWLDREYYPIATTTTQNALMLMNDLHSDIHLPAITRIYEDLRTSSYGKSTDVARLGVETMRVKHAHLFH